MRKAMWAAAMAMALCLAGCEGVVKSRAPQGNSSLWNSQRYCATVGEEVPPGCILGSTYDRAEQLEQAKTFWGRAADTAGYYWDILSHFIGK